MAKESILKAPLAIRSSTQPLGRSDQPRSLWRAAAERLLTNPLSQLGLLISVFFLSVAIFAPIIDPYDATIDSNLSERLKPPSTEYWLGTDEQGRDILRRIAHGARASLGIGLGVVSISIVIGTVIGLVSGYAGRTLDLGLMFLMDIVLAFPALLLAIAIVALLGPGLLNSMLAISITGIPTYARISRSTVLSLKQQEFITAARCVGAPQLHVLVRHIFPNSLSPVIVLGSLGIAHAILTAAALGFLGLGQQPPYPEWGAMLADTVKYLSRGAWWVLLFPGLAIMLTVIGYNLLGDGLRDALDPRIQV